MSVRHEYRHRLPHRCLPQSGEYADQWDKGVNADQIYRVQFWREFQGNRQGGTA